MKVYAIEDIEQLEQEITNLRAQCEALKTVVEAAKLNLAHTVECSNGFWRNGCVCGLGTLLSMIDALEGE